MAICDDKLTVLGQVLLDQDVDYFFLGESVFLACHDAAFKLLLHRLLRFVCELNRYATTLAYFANLLLQAE